MIKIIFSLLIGIIYGVSFYIIPVSLDRFLYRKLTKGIKINANINFIRYQIILISIISGLLAGAFFLTSLFFRPFFEDWDFFKKMFGVGFVIGIFTASNVWRGRQRKQ